MRKAFVLSRPLLLAFAFLPLTVASFAGCGSASSSPGPSSPEFKAVQAIFDARCVSCHDARATPSPGRTTYPALPLTAGSSYASLVNRRAHETCGGTLVIPGNLGGSYLESKLTEETPCEGGRMPAGGEAVRPQPLSQAELDTIAAWINAGAPD